jgi:myo-inositol-1(or 4)-monophosphatase
MTPSELTPVAIAAANAGATKLLEGLNRPKQVQLKSDRASIVTWADEASQAAIAGVVLETFPGHEIMGEEGSAGDPHGPFVWIVDPLDGTTNYARGLMPWGVSVAVREREGPVLAGVIVDPGRGETFVAERGQPAAYAVSDTGSPRSALVATGLQNDDPEVIKEFVARVERLHLNCRGVRAIGSPALAIAYVATGRLDAFVEKDATYAWDIAAAALMVEHAGGRVTDFDGGPINLGRGVANVVASNGRWHDELLAIVNG